jgi:hypothetical protein
LAADWAKGAKLGILKESEVRGPLPDLPVWYFGLGPAARRAVSAMSDPGTIPPGDAGGKGAGLGATPDAGWKLAGADLPPGRAVVIAGGAPPRAWTLLDLPVAAGIPSIGRKITHYGKFSWLVFDGDTNVGKGMWDVLSSPLRVSFK